MNSLGRDQVARLYDLAQTRTEQARRVLVENISDLFLTDHGRLTEHQRMLMTDILYKLIHDMELAVRKELSDRVADVEGVPVELVRMLANDSIEIARPFLEKSPLLRDEDLIEIVRARSDEHRMCIALRARLSEEVSDALVEEGNVDVIETLLRNPTARISERAMDYLVMEARRTDRFQEPLLSRHDLPAPLAHRLFWQVSAALRRKILLEHSDVDPAELDILLQQATQSAISSHNPEEGTWARAERLVTELAAANELNISFLTRALKQQRIPVFIAGLGHMASIHPRIVWRIFSDHGGESFTVLCRALDMGRSEFATLYLVVTEIRSGQRVRSTAFLKEAMDLYDAIAPANARAALAFWQRDIEYQRALDEIGHAE